MWGSESGEDDFNLAKMFLQKILYYRESSYLEGKLVQRPYTLHKKYWNQNIIIITRLMHKKPYFQSSGVSWKAQKDEVNIIFSSTFWLKTRPCFPSPKSSKQEIFSVIRKHGIPRYRKNHLIIFWGTENTLSWFLKHHARFVNTKERSFY